MHRTGRKPYPIAFLFACAACGFASMAAAAEVSFSGTIRYDGTSQGDSLYVAVLDTAGGEDVTLLDLERIDVGASPFTQAYALSFDNATASAQLLIAAFLDVDGGGIEGEISGVDVFGWYAGTSSPAAVSSAASQSGLDFALPTGEIRGTVTFSPTQVEARIDVSTDPACLSEGFRPRTVLLNSGDYAIVGVYPGTYCVRADGVDSAGNRSLCYGPSDCLNPTLITLSEGEVFNDVDFYFDYVNAAEASSFGLIKSRFR